MSDEPGDPLVDWYKPTKYICQRGHETTGQIMCIELDGRPIPFCPTCIGLFMVSQGWEVKVKE